MSGFICLKSERKYFGQFINSLQILFVAFTATASSELGRKIEQQ